MIYPYDETLGPMYSTIVKKMLAHPSKRKNYPIDYLLKSGHVLYSGYSSWRNIKTKHRDERLKVGDMVKYISTETRFP